MENKTYDYSGYAFRPVSRKKLSVKTIIAIIIAVVIIFIMIFYYAQFPRELSINEKIYYAVEVFSSSSIESAELYASGIKGANGAGTIVFDKKYRVIAAIYHKQKDAESVINKLKTNHITASLYIWQFPFVSLSLNINYATMNILKQATEKSLKLLDDMLNMALSFDKKEVDKNSIISAIEEKTIETENIAKLLSPIRHNTAKIMANSYNDIYDSLTNLSLDINSGTLKNTYGEIAVIIYDMLNDINLSVEDYEEI